MSYNFKNNIRYLSYVPSFYPRFFWWVRVADYLFSCVCCFIVSLRSEFRVVMSVTISAQKLCSARLFTPVVIAHALFTLFVIVCV